MATLTIPLVTLTVGLHEFGPAAVADADTLIRLSVDRTVANGFNSQPATTTMLLYIFQSDDGGVTWTWIAGDLVTGGVYTSVKAGPENTDYVEVHLNPGASRQVRAQLTVSGASVAVAGSLTTS